MMVDFFLISSQASISTFSTMEDQRNGSNKSSYFWWKYIDVDLSYWKSHQQFPIKHRPYFGEVDLGAPPGSPRTKPAMIQCSLRASHKFVKLMISWAMKDNVPSTTRLDCSRLNFTNFFFGGGKQVESPGVLRNLGYVYILKLFTMIVVRGGSFHVQWYHLKD